MPSSLSSQSSSSGSPQRVLGQVSLGDNSSRSGSASEYSVGVASTGETVYGQRTWDPDLSDGLDSGWVEVQLNVGNNAVAWTVAGGTTVPLTLTDLPVQAIKTVSISAAVASSGCRMSWSGIHVEFYRNGTLTEALNVDPAAEPVADSIDPGSSVPPLTLSPSSDDNTAVVVTARVRLQSTSTTLPPVDAIQGSIGVSVA